MKGRTFFLLLTNKNSEDPYFDKKTVKIAQKCAKSNEKQLKSHIIELRSTEIAMQYKEKGHRQYYLYGCARIDAVMRAMS